ncbi:MAG: SAM-dependent DNA methyltransferase [Acholeplasmatales bacterium]|nr:SAM-dependent DNA methyltransferase [Acholeplasmatales bacterium]
MQDVKLNNLELFYDVVDESNNYLYEIFRKPYFELIEMTVNNILAGEILTDFEEPEQAAKLQEIYDKLIDVDFTVEDVRKAMQSIILRGFKEMRIPNGNTTPDTLGIFLAYLITKICKNKDISILDPLCGTGNLLLTIYNHLDKNCTLYACDNDLWMTKLTAMTADLLSATVDIYLQDTMTLSLSGIDAIVFDAPHSEPEGNEYFPYKAILHYSNMVKDEGALIGIVENDFFDYDSNQKFKEELLKTMSIIGLVELPDSMFKASKPKIIIVLQKRHLEDKKCFMVKLPSFTDVKEFNESLLDIEAWFEKNNYNKISEEK